MKKKQQLQFSKTEKSNKRKILSKKFLGNNFQKLNKKLLSREQNAFLFCERLQNLKKNPIMASHTYTHIYNCQTQRFCVVKHSKKWWKFSIQQPLHHFIVIQNLLLAPELHKVPSKRVFATPPPFLLIITLKSVN